MVKRIVIVVSSVVLVLSLIGFIATMILNAFVFDDYDAYGEVPIPGSGQVHLPAGEVTVSFHTLVIGSPSGGGLPVPQLGFDIDPPDGVAEPAVTEDYGGTTTVNNDAHRRVWVMQVPAEGDYTITTDGQTGGFINPRLAFGHANQHGNLVWVFVASFVVALLSLIGTLLWWPRKRRPVVPPYLVEQLNHLTALRDSGALTPAEFEAEKRRILETG